MNRLLVILGLVLFASCSSYDYVIESDYSYDGNFNKYKSFDFVMNKDFSGTDKDQEIIERYLKSTFQSWGYDYEDKKPNLLIFYSLYFDDMDFHGFNQPHFQYWLRSNYRDDEVVFKKDTLADGSLVDSYSPDTPYKDESYEKIRHELREGTILISLFDRRKRKTVWQGYASGVFGEERTKNERIMKSAVIRILDEYKLLAFGSS